MLLIIPSIMVAQEFKENLNISLNTDFAMIKEQKLNIGAELELDMKPIYFKIGFENFALDLNYLDFHGAIGTNLRLGMYQDTRIYAGLRAGKIWREDKTTVPLFGIESGVQYNINNNIAFKLYGTYDYRTEGEFLGYDKFYQFSAKASIVIKISNLRK